MGCNQSNAAREGGDGEFDSIGVPSPNAKPYMVSTKGGSLVLKRGSRHGGAAAEADDPRLVKSRGGSLIVPKAPTPVRGAGGYEAGFGGHSDANGGGAGGAVGNGRGSGSPRQCDLATRAGGRLQLRWGTKTLQGRSSRPPHKPNQDSFLAVAPLWAGGAGAGGAAHGGAAAGNGANGAHGGGAGGGSDAPPCAVFAVFDGHGPYGEHASDFCRAHFCDLLRNQEGFASWAAGRRHHTGGGGGGGAGAGAEEVGAAEECSVALHNSIVELHRAFVSGEAPTAPGVDPLVSGTTCVTCFFDGDVLYTANLGDSRAILARRVDGDGGGEGGPEAVESVALSSDHKPNRRDEKERLLRSSAVLITERQLRGSGGDEDKIYICREKHGDIIYGVMFTRSIGDLDAHAHLGVTEEPEIHAIALDPSVKFIVLATDGVWDKLDNDEVVAIVDAFDDPLEAAAELTARATRRWEEAADQRRDDITAVVVMISHDP